jgi:hypothetical protein
MSQLHVFDDGTDLVVAEDAEDATILWIDYMSAAGHDGYEGEGFAQRYDLDRIKIGNRSLLCKNWVKQGRGFLGTREAT